MAIASSGLVVLFDLHTCLLNHYPHLLAIDTTLCDTSLRYDVPAVRILDGSPECPDVSTDDLTGNARTVWAQHSTLLATFVF